MLLGKYLNTMDLLIHCFTVDVSIFVLSDILRNTNIYPIYIAQITFFQSYSPIHSGWDR
jgi:hypothetical protein